nr:hypothetical protein OG690_37570 [Streptomyces tubercidicus]
MHRPEGGAVPEGRPSGCPDGRAVGENFVGQLLARVGVLVRPLAKNDPQQIGPFRIIGLLGGGGMGRVYLGRAGGRAAGGGEDRASTSGPNYESSASPLS